MHSHVELKTDDGTHSLCLSDGQLSRLRDGQVALAIRQLSSKLIRQNKNIVSVELEDGQLRCFDHQARRCFDIHLDSTPMRWPCRDLDVTVDGVRCHMEVETCVLRHEEEDLVQHRGRLSMEEVHALRGICKRHPYGAIHNRYRSENLFLWVYRIRAYRIRAEKEAKRYKCLRLKKGRGLICYYSSNDLEDAVDVVSRTACRCGHSDPLFVFDQVEEEAVCTRLGRGI